MSRLAFTNFRFPHCMWGYIARALILCGFPAVPSLYVRVYRQNLGHNREDVGSLIICEGVSLYAPFCSTFEKFPHYMWGCIDMVDKSPDCLISPSLYVRVYRFSPTRSLRQACSLIICEGVSCHQLPSSYLTQFPHYTWGCITLSRLSPAASAVPSLQVRVYRGTKENVKALMGSLIICEGVSIWLINHPTVL